MQDLATMDFAALMPSLPPRVRELGAHLNRTDWPHEPSRWSLSRGGEPTPAERQEARQAAQTFRDLLDPGANFMGVRPHDARMAIATQLILWTAKTNETVTSTNAKLDAYEAGLYGVPAWAVAKAVLRWQRAEVPTAIDAAPNYNWLPPPQTIKRLAEHELAYARSALSVAERVAAAVTHERAMDPKPLPRPTVAAPFAAKLQRM